MRPENTAGVVRAVIEQGLAAGPMPLRLYYVGPQFRYERPQAGRYREFSQIGVELFGVAGPAAEAEVLEMLFDFLRGAGFPRALRVPELGRDRRRPARQFGEALRAHLRAARGSLRRGRPPEARRQSAAALRLEGSRRPERRSRALRERVDFLDDASRRHHDDVRAPARGGRNPVPRRSDARARPRLLHAHGLRGRLGGPGRAGRDPGRRAVRRPRRVPGRPSAARHRLRDRRGPAPAGRSARAAATAVRGRPAAEARGPSGGDPDRARDPRRASDPAASRWISRRAGSRRGWPEPAPSSKRRMRGVSTARECSPSWLGNASARREP